MRRITLIVGVLVLSNAGPVLARQNTSERESAYDRIWARTQLYSDPSNSIIQSFSFVGRFQLDHARVDADQGSASEWNVRRLRLGGEAEIFNRLTFHGEVDLNPQERDPTYLRLTDFYLRWSGSDALAVTLGKQGASFTLDGSTSSKELLTVERSNVSNNLWFPTEYVPGLSIVYARGLVSYHTGVYSAGAPNREFGEFSGSYFAVAAITYDVSGRFGVEDATVSAQIVRQSADPDNGFTRPLRTVGSVQFRYETGAWGVRAEVGGADGQLGQSDVRGASVMPFWNVTDRFQLVGRWSVVSSIGENGVRLTRYESSAVSGRGDRYSDLYAGANYYLYGHKLKLQTGLQRATLADEASDGGAYEGISWTTGLRVSW